MPANRVPSEQFGLSFKNGAQIWETEKRSNGLGNFFLYLSGENSDPTAKGKRGCFRLKPEDPAAAQKSKAAAYYLRGTPIGDIRSAAYGGY